MSKDGRADFAKYLSTALAHTTYATPTALARAATVSPSAMSRWINGLERPSPRAIEKIAPFLPSPTEPGRAADASALIKIAYPEVDLEASDGMELVELHPLAVRLNRLLSPQSSLTDDERGELERNVQRTLSSFDQASGGRTG